MNKLIKIVLAVILITGLSFNVYARCGEVSTCGEIKVMDMQSCKILDKLKLTDEQKAKIDTIIAEKKAKIEALKTEIKTEIKAVLNPEQIKLFEGKCGKMDKSMSHKMHKHELNNSKHPCSSDCAKGATEGKKADK